MPAPQEPRAAPAGEADVYAFVALGANLGDRVGALRRAVEGLGVHPQIRVEAVSPLYETPAHTLPPHAPQPPYLNAVVRLRTTLPPERLLAYAHELERAAGRVREGVPRWSPRPLDLDLLLYGRERRSGGARGPDSLVLPHPRLGERRFVLRPLADLAPNFYVPPPFSTTVADLLARCPDPTVPVPVTSPRWDAASRP